MPELTDSKSRSGQIWELLQSLFELSETSALNAEWLISHFERPERGVFWQ